MNAFDTIDISVVRPLVVFRTDGQTNSAKENAEAHANLGLALLASGNPRDSIPEFETALRLNPELTGAADNLQRAQAQLGSQR